MQTFTAHTEKESLWEGLVKMGRVMHSLLQFHDISVILKCLERVGVDGWVCLSSGETQVTVSQVWTFPAGRVLRQYWIQLVISGAIPVTGGYLALEMIVLFLLKTVCDD